MLFLLDLISCESSSLTFLPGRFYTPLLPIPVIFKLYYIYPISLYGPCGEEGIGCYLKGISLIAYFFEVVYPRILNQPCLHGVSVRVFLPLFFFILLPRSYVSSLKKLKRIQFSIPRCEYVLSGSLIVVLILLWFANFIYCII